MMGRTHATIGLAVGLGVGVLAHSTLPESVGLALLGGLSALLPDIDHPNGQIRRKLGVAGHVSLFWLSHRGLTHTLLFSGLIWALSYLIAPQPAQMAVTLGWVSHLVADAMTRAGIPLLWPLSGRSIHALPRLLRFPTGGWEETVVWFLVLAYIIAQVVTWK